MVKIVTIVIVANLMQFKNRIFHPVIFFYNSRIPLCVLFLIYSMLQIFYLFHIYKWFTQLV